MTHYSSCEAAIADAAKGNAKALIWCFVWWRSVEGEAYWAKQYSLDHVTPAAKHKLRLLLRRRQRAKRVWPGANRLPYAIGLREIYGTQENRHG